MKRPDVLVISNHTLTQILNGTAQARSCYFTKKNVFENKTEVVGPYLEDGNHWTLFHCSIVDRTVTYLSSLGETEQKYLVSSDELRRRCSLPESYSANTVVAYLRKAKGQKKKIIEKLEELEVMPSKRTKLTSQCSKLCEDECRDLAGDLMYLATKFIPQKRVGQAMLEEGDVHATMAKTEDCRKTLQAVKDALESNWETFDLATHGLGPAVIKGTFSLIDACLKEKMRALKSKDSTDE
ncbi:hypothetical protein DPEC_G00222000 [Dallia pectoralis]|uniref:Uncharacterized protein n=1 Tax=Dallia pectoralis TaxID=75939 RepID=A0ACC2G488_DALPE|nr:hypothetical protein DPEC_G00222000 [Dallia pectoralis]